MNALVTGEAKRKPALRGHARRLGRNAQAHQSGGQQRRHLAPTLFGRHPLGGVEG